MDRGTLLQLRNLINRRNVSADTSGKFNASVDFFELVLRCHIIAAAMYYFGMRSIDDTPTSHSFPLNDDATQQWTKFHRAVSQIVEHFVFVQDFSKVTESAPPAQCQENNPHYTRIMKEHTYAHCDRSACQEPSRVLPQSIRRCADYPNTPTSVKSNSPDKILDYACSVMTDGMLLLEFRDAVHEGDGERLMRCWRLMLLYFTYSGHKKYALEALSLQAAVSATANTRLAKELLTSRFVNSQGGPGKNIPTDLFMEHLNRTLKDYYPSLGANISDSTIVQIAKSLKTLMDISSNFDHTFELHPESLHHTSMSSKKDRDLILAQLTDSRVFEYIPGRFHPTFRNIKSHISECVNVDKLVAWVRDHQGNMANNIELEKILHH